MDTKRPGFKFIQQALTAGIAVDVTFPPYDYMRIFRASGSLRFRQYPDTNQTDPMFQGMDLELGELNEKGVVNVVSTVTETVSIFVSWGGVRLGGMISSGSPLGLIPLWRVMGRDLNGTQYTGVSENGIFCALQGKAPSGIDLKTLARTDDNWNLAACPHNVTGALTFAPATGIGYVVLYRARATDAQFEFANFAVGETVTIEGQRWAGTAWDVLAVIPGAGTWPLAGLRPYGTLRFTSSVGAGTGVTCSYVLEK